ADITSRDGKSSKWSDSSDQVERWNHFQAEMSSSSETSGSMRVGL
ncbi:14998_t:CDS:1, partial [Rhizophagus irregularis]